MTVTTQDVVDYMGADAVTRWYVPGPSGTATYPQIDDALAAERIVQLGVVSFPVSGYTSTTDDLDTSALDEALKRRVVRNLAMRQLPLAIQSGDSESGPIRVGSNDPEIRRLEARYRRRVVG